MDWQNIILFVIVILNILLGFTLVRKNYRNEINISYALITLWTSIWTLGIAFFRYSDDLSVLFFWNKIFIIFAAIIFSSIFHFCLVFPHTEIKITNFLRFLIYLPNIIIILAVLTPGVMIEDIVINDWGNESILGRGYIYYGLYISLLTFISFVILINKFKKSFGRYKIQLVYTILGIFISVIFGATFNLIYILLGNYKYIWLGPYASFIMFLFIGYAILKHRLMDIRIVARKAVVYLGMSIFVYVIFEGLLWVYNNFFGGLYSKSSYIAGIFIAPLFVLTFYILDKGLKKFANKYLFYSLYNYQETINRISQELNYYTDLNKVINTIVDNVKKTMKLDRAGVLLINQKGKIIHYRIAKVIGFNKNNGISLVEDNFLTKYLKKAKRPLVREELELLAKEAVSQKDKKSFLKLYDHMKKIEASVCLPLMKSGNLIGIIVLGSKISGDAYTKEDLDLLNTLANQASIAIDNARLYKEVKDFSKTLQQKVDEQTKRLKEANKELRMQNNLNKELLEMKSDFLRVVNHQLNTPLSVMRGYFSMMEEGNYTPKQAMPAIKEGLNRINQTVADFWDAYELEGERMKMNPQKVDITDIIDKLIKEKKNLPLAKQRKLSIRIEKPDFKVPVVWCDFKKIAHVISNLLDNAVFYTYQGEIVLSYKLEGKDYLKISIKDTGVGLSEEDRKALFQKFSRGKAAVGMHPDGSGLGLYIARKIIEGNGGEMTVESKGKDKGSTFSFTLPIFKSQKVKKGEETMMRREKIEIF